MFIGQTIQTGDPLYSIYSPDAFTALREFFQARQREGKLSKTTAPDELADATSLRQAAQRKLDLWGVTPRSLTRWPWISTRREIFPDHVTVLATAGGIVTRKEIRQGGYLQAGDIPFTVADLSSVWLNAKIYESDVPLVKVGQMANVTATGDSRQNIHGQGDVPGVSA